MSTPYLPPVERPRSPLMRLVFVLSRRFLGKVPTPLAVASARMPFAFLRHYVKVSMLDRKLALPQDTALLVREQVARLNACLFCMDTQRWFVTKRAVHMLARFDAIPEFRTSLLFSEAERSALAYAEELTTSKHVSPQTFARLAEHFSDRECCEIAWLVASEHYYNISNHGLNIGSDNLCELGSARPEDRVEALAGSR